MSESSSRKIAAFIQLSRAICQFWMEWRPLISYEILSILRFCSSLAACSMGCWQGLSCWSIKAPKPSILSFISRISLCAALRVSQQSCFSFAILSLRWPLVLTSFLIGVPKLILLAFLKETGFMVASLGSLPYQPYLMMSNFSFSVLFSREMFSIEWLFESYLSTNFLYLSNQNRQFSSLRFTFSYRLDYPRQRRSSSPRLSVCSNWEDCSEFSVICFLISIKKSLKLTTLFPSCCDTSETAYGCIRLTSDFFSELRRQLLVFLTLEVSSPSLSFILQTLLLLVNL